MKPLFVTYRRMPAIRFVSSHRRIFSCLIGILVVSVLGAGLAIQPLKDVGSDVSNWSSTGVPDYDISVWASRARMNAVAEPGGRGLMPFNAPGRKTRVLSWTPV